MDTTRKSIIGRIIYRLEGVRLYIHAYLTGLSHFFRGHDVIWFEDPDPWCGHFGFIMCHDCPDTIDEDQKEAGDLCIWGHDIQWLRRYVLQPICGRLGHTDISEWEDGKTGNPSGEFYCERCIKSVERPVN